MHCDHAHLQYLSKPGTASQPITAAIIYLRVPYRSTPSPGVLEKIEAFANTASSAILSVSEAPLAAQLLQALAYVLTLVTRLNGRPGQPLNRS